MLIEIYYEDTLDGRCAASIALGTWPDSNLTAITEGIPFHIGEYFTIVIGNDIEAFLSQAPREANIRIATSNKRWMDGPWTGAIGSDHGLGEHVCSLTNYTKYTSSRYVRLIGEHAIRGEDATREAKSLVTVLNQVNTKPRSRVWEGLKDDTLLDYLIKAGSNMNAAEASIEEWVSNCMARGDLDIAATRAALPYLLESEYPDSPYADYFWPEKLAELLLIGSRLIKECPPELETADSLVHLAAFIKKDVADRRKRCLGK